MLISCYRYFVVAFAFTCSVAVATECEPTSPNLMRGAPVASDKLVTTANMMQAPYNRWAFQNMQQLQASRAVFRGNESPTHLQEHPVDFGSITADLGNGRKLNFDAWLEDSCTDAFLVLHKGRIVYERYFNGMTPASRHMMASVTKSFVSTITLGLIEEGKIDATRPIKSYLEELKDSAFGDATVQQVLNMTTSLRFSEEYSNPQADIWKYALAISPAGMVPSGYEGPGTIYQYLPTLRKGDGEHGRDFHYVTPNTDVLAWLNSRVTGENTSTLLSDKIWQKLGAQRDAYFTLGSAATEIAGGGFNATARDAARFGQMILQGGQYNGQRVLQEAVAERILQPGTGEVMDRGGEDPWYGEVIFAYHDMWWTFNNPHKAVSAIGIHGQYIYLDAVADMVMVKQSSHPDAESEINDVVGPQMWHQMAKFLMRQ